MKFKNIVVYENNSNKFDIGNCWTKVGHSATINFFSFTTVQTCIQIP